MAGRGMVGRRRDDDDERDGREDRGLGAPDIMTTGEGVVESSALERITRSEIDVQIATAHRFPRSIARFKQEALSMATLDEETAAACFYVVPRAGKNIEGPSIRLAEIVAGCWGNLRAETRVIDEDDHFVTAQAMCIDLERNVAIRTEVQRRITDKFGHKFKDDMIVTTANAASSIALRNAVFRVVPMAYVKPVFEQAKRVAVGDIKTLRERRQRAIEWFSKLGVTQDRVLFTLQKSSIEDVDLDDLLKLQGLRTAIQDGASTVEDSFPAPAMPADGKVKVGKNGTATPVQETKPSALETKADEEPPHDPVTGEVFDSKKAPPGTSKAGF